MFAEPMDKYILEVGGFTPYEISEFEQSPTVINLDEQAWQNVAESRLAWITDKTNRGWSQADINLYFAEYYARDETRTPFDFLREIYGIPEMTSKMQTDIDKYKGGIRAMREREAEETRRKTEELWRQ